ncbi:MAG: tetratricopeptide repeat protein [Verrucomicrobia bacterium]|nr:tetratricopeptide repeat protein [Verrucomicrobiota bacterium]
MMILVVAALAAYHNSLHGPFVFDDHGSIVENPSIRQLWPPSTWFQAPVEAGVAGRPLANLTFALNHAVGGLDVQGYHWFNLALHTITAGLLFGLVRRTLQQPDLRTRFGVESTGLALACASLWLVHPLTTAAVNYVSQRTELLASLCLALTLYAFVRSLDGPARPWRAFAMVASALGMAAKETMVAAPVIVWLYDCSLVSGGWRAAWRARRCFYTGLAATWLVLGLLMANSHLTERGIGFGLGLGWFDYAIASAGAQLRYVGLALWPSPLIFDYGWITPHPATSDVVAVAGLAILAIGVIAGWRRRPAWAFGGVAFFVLLAPSSSIVPIVQQPIAESRAYLPMMPLLTLVVLIGHRLFGKRGWLLFGGVAVLACSLTAHRNRDYHSPVTLWADTLAKRPDSARAHCNLAAVLLESGATDSALKHAQTALTLRPGYADAHTNAGAALVRTGRAAEAVPHLESALRLRPLAAQSHYNLANALLRSGRIDEGVAGLKETLRLAPAHVQAHNDLSVGLLSLDRTAEALMHGIEAARLAPQSADAHYNLANVLARLGRIDEAIAELETALRLQPGFAKAHHNLGALFLRTGRAAAAVEQFETAVRLRPDYAEARRHLEIARRASPP